MASRLSGDNPLTITEIADAIGEYRHKIEYLIESRAIQPCRRAGNCKLYPAATLQVIRAEIARLDRKREGGAA